jgi:1,4-dihydroxy-2-naphthoate octaprenyltransferase
MISIPMGVAGVLGYFFHGVLYAQFTWLAILPAGLIAVMAKTPAEYITVLKITSFATMVYGILVGIGFALS